MELLNQLSGYLEEFTGPVALAGLLLGLAAFILVLVTRSRIRMLLRPLKSMGHGAEDFHTAIPTISKAVDSNRVRIDGLTRSVEELTEKSFGYFTHVGLVRYDAFDDVGGQQSYSLCLLDGHKNGVLLTYITGRNSTRSYAVSVNGGVPSRKLGEEEVRAMDEALTGEPAGKGA